MVLQSSLYLLGLARERTVQLCDQSDDPRVTEFAELLRGRDVFFVRDLTGENAAAEQLTESMILLQRTLVNHVRTRGTPCVHWMTQLPTDVHQLAFELAEEESGRRGELTALLGLQETDHRF